MVLYSFKHLAIRFLRALPGAANTLYQEDILEKLREITCYNQGKLAIYTFQANEKHKSLKNKLREIENSGNPVSENNLEELRSCLNNLSNYLDREFRIVSENNFQYLTKFFTNRHHRDKRIRVCVKAVQADQIITLARDTYYGLPQEPFPIEDNAAFSTAIETGRFYLCNNIPESISKGNYRSFRIYEDAARSFYKKCKLTKNLRYRYSQEFDTDWQNCWRRVEIDGSEKLPPPETCYKSTLIIPMTLLSDPSYMSSEFRQHFNVNSNTQKMVFGFLGLDHPNINFFNKKGDIDIGYIIADILSLYLIQRLSYISYSRVYNDSEFVINNSRLRTQ